MTRLDELQNLIPDLPTGRSKDLVQGLLEDLEIVTTAIAERASCPRCSSCASTAEILRDHLYKRYR